MNQIYAKGHKGDAVLVAYFIRGGVPRLIYQQQGGVLCNWLLM